MTPWAKEKEMKRVALWMYEENPEIWYTPYVATKHNPHFPDPKLELKVAEEIFLDLGYRKYLKPHFPIIKTENKNGEWESRQISTWMLNQEYIGDLWLWIEDKTFWTNYILPIFRGLLSPRRKEKWISLLMTGLGIFVASIINCLGVDVYGLIVRFLKFLKAIVIEIL